MTPLEIIRQAQADTLIDEDGKVVTLELLPGLTRAELLEFARQVPCPIPPEIAELLSACRGLTVMATSRVPLHLYGERLYPVAPLGVPALDDLPPLTDVAQSAAVQLFVVQAQTVAPAFSLTPDNIATVAAICHRLDGLPLAIELAVAQLQVLSLVELQNRLDQQLSILTGGARDQPERHHTM